MRKKKKKWTKLGHDKLKAKWGKTKSSFHKRFTFDVTPTDTAWSIGRTILQTSITETTVPDTHILQEPDNLSTTPQLVRMAPSHTPFSEARIPDIQTSARPDYSSSLAHTITQLVDSIFKLNQLLKKEREKSERLLCENFTLKTKNLELQSRNKSNAESGKNPKENDYTVAKKAMEIRTSLISDAGKVKTRQPVIEPCNNEHCANKKSQIATEVKANKKSRSA